MANLIQGLRVKKLLENLYKDQQDKSQSPYTGLFGTPAIKPTVVMTASPLDAPDMMANLRLKPETPETDKLKAYLRSEPNRADFQQGKVAKVLAGIAGFTEGLKGGAGAAYNTTRGLLDEPYNRAKSDWQSQGARLKALSDIERSTLTDNQKLQVQIADLDFKNLKELHDWNKTQSDIEYNDKRIENLNNEIKAKGLSLEKNTKTGDLEVVDKLNGTRQSMGQFALSAEETAQAEREKFEREEKLRQKNRRELQDDAQAHATILKGIDLTNAKELANLRATLTRGNDKAKADLEKMTPSQQKAAFDLVYGEIITDDPDLIKRDPGGFMNRMRLGLDNVRRRATGENTPYQPYNAVPSVNIPTAPPVSIPQQDSLRLNGAKLNPAMAGSSDTVTVINKDGIRGVIPANQLQDALKEGYTLAR